MKAHWTQRHVERALLILPGTMVKFEKSKVCLKQQCTALTLSFDRPTPRKEVIFRSVENAALWVTKTIVLILPAPLRSWLIKKQIGISSFSFSGPLSYTFHLNRFLQGLNLSVIDTVAYEAALQLISSLKSYRVISVLQIQESSTSKLSFLFYEEW